MCVLYTHWIFLKPLFGAGQHAGKSHVLNQDDFYRGMSFPNPKNWIGRFSQGIVPRPPKTNTFGAKYKLPPKSGPCNDLMFVFYVSVLNKHQNIYRLLHMDFFSTLVMFVRGNIHLDWRESDHSPQTKWQTSKMFRFQTPTWCTRRWWPSNHKLKKTK